jgi:menaquinone-dependent protoporphyrinogen oxidase
VRILIVYGTSEGHTRDLSAFVANCLRDDGHEAIVRDSAPHGAAPDPRTYDLVFLAASLHVGRYQAALVQYARSHHETLNAMPTAFISVSLSAAGENPNDWEGLEQCDARFLSETLWKPMAIHHAAGAIRYSQYDFFKRLALKYIAVRRGERTMTLKDYDLTDYDAVKAFVQTFVKEHPTSEHLHRHRHPPV